MDHSTIEKLNQSMLIKAFLVVFLLAQLVIMFFILNLPDGVQQISAHLVENNETFYHPVTLRVIEPYIVEKEGIELTKIEILAPGDYSFTIIGGNGEQREVSFSVFIYEQDVLFYLALSSLVPLLLLIYSLKRGQK
jgi:hypothetical protein